jgi:hypothetical protein
MVDYTTGKDPGDGYRWLAKGERIELTDEICSMGLISNACKIQSIASEIAGCEWHPYTWWPIRRKTSGILDGF